jgi:hypothetical protein
MIVSMLSVFFSGSKSTRLFKQGMAGHTVEMVDVSWIAKPGDSSSRSIIVSVPPGFGVWPRVGAADAPTMARTTRATSDRATSARDM